MKKKQLQSVLLKVSIVHQQKTTTTAFFPSYFPLDIIQ